MLRSWRTALLISVLACVVAACAPSVNPLAGEAVPGDSPAGFLLGLWHGFTVLFTFVVSLFSDSVGVYEVHNTGWPYNLGYLIGVMAFFSGSGGAAGSKGRERG
jgi:hypothetical protein